MKQRRARGRPLADKRMEWSEEHRYVLAFCAVKANRLLFAERGFAMPVDEMMAEGWWKCLRRCKEGSLRKAIGNTIREMIRFGKHQRPKQVAGVGSRPTGGDWDSDGDDWKPSGGSQHEPSCAPDVRYDHIDELAVLTKGVPDITLRIATEYWGHGRTWDAIGADYGKSGQWARNHGAKFMELTRAKRKRGPVDE